MCGFVYETGELLDSARATGLQPSRKPRRLRTATESLSVVESDPLPTTTHTKGLS